MWVLIVMMVGGGSVDPVTSFDHVEFNDEAAKAALEGSDVPSRRFVDCFEKGEKPQPDGAHPAR